MLSSPWPAFGHLLRGLGLQLLASTAQQNVWDGVTPGRPAQGLRSLAGGSCWEPEAPTSWPSLHTSRTRIPRNRHFESYLPLLIDLPIGEKCCIKYFLKKSFQKQQEADKIVRDYQGKIVTEDKSQEEHKASLP